MSNRHHISPEIRAFLASNGWEFLYKHVVGMSYQDFITTPSWNIACWGASLECIRKHAELAFDTYQARSRIGTVGMELKKDTWCRGRSDKPKNCAIPAATANPTPHTVDEHVRKSRAQALGDRCCGAPRRDRSAAYNPPDVHRVIRAESPDNVYRTKAFY